MVLYGRAAEQEVLSGLLTRARNGTSGALVVRGEAGIGKTALLDWLADQARTSPADQAPADQARTSPAAEARTSPACEAPAPGEQLRLLRVTGVEPEADLAYGGLLQLLWPVQDRLPALPPAQAAALRSVLGSDQERGADRFLTGLAVLTLLAELAEDGPVLCLVDDAQWIDQATAEALLFAARRLSAERVAVVFAARDDGFVAPGLPELRLARLPEEHARRVLQRQGLAPALHSQILTESDGNPLALIEFAAAERDHRGHPVPLPVADRVLSSFRAQVGRLPERSRLLMLTAAAEGRGDLPLVLEAARLLGVGPEDLEHAERARLVQVVHDLLIFRHPLVASAAYQGAALARRIAVHQALARAAKDPDCRARHLASATTTPDEEVAAELAAAAERARGRAAYAASARLFEHAARVAPDLDRQAELLVEAAVQALTAGHAALATDLADRAESRTGAAAVRIRLASLRAAVVAETDDHRQAARLLLDSAQDARPDEAAELLRASGDQAWQAGDPAVLRKAASGLRAVGTDDPLITALAELTDENYARALPLLRGFVAENSASPQRLLIAAGLLGDDETVSAVAGAELTRCREQALIGRLPQALEAWAELLVITGRQREAEAAVIEAEQIAHDTGLHRRLARLAAVRVRMAAVEGREDRCQETADALMGSESPALLAARALLDLGLGRPAEVLERLEAVPPGLRRAALMPLAATADLVEAAVRLESPERAAEPLRRFATWAEAAGSRWGRAVVLRCRALLAEHQIDVLGNETPEDLYGEALRLHEGAGRPFEHARTALLYGEWLRRARRRTDSRPQLRVALDIFDRLGAAPWAERARAELRASGETVVPAQPVAENLADRLTPQELQVVRLAASGHSSREIAAQLFLSRRTVEHHLYKAYPKLGISSRRELATLDLDRGTF